MVHLGSSYLIHAALTGLTRAGSYMPSLCFFTHMSGVSELLNHSVSTWGLILPWPPHLSEPGGLRMVTFHRRHLTSRAELPGFLRQPQKSQNTISVMFYRSNKSLIPAHIPGRESDPTSQMESVAKNLQPS